MSENFAELLNDYYFDVSEGQIIDGIITEVKRDRVILDIGFKGESTIDKSEFIEMDGSFPYKEGDAVKVYVDQLDNGEGLIVLSFAKAKEFKNWGFLTNALEENKTVKAKVEKSIRGGLIVSLDGVQGFLPSSLVDVKPLKDLDSLVGKVVDVKVIKMDESAKTILVSRKATMVEGLENPQTILSRIQEGDVVNGTVKNITEYGVFVDLGGVDGLLHITDISWTRIENPSEKFEIGQSVKLKVSKFDEKSKKISLSLKALDDSPWKDFIASEKVGNIVKAKVVKFVDYGCFVLINNNLDGLIHNTEIAWDEKNANPSDYLQEGQEIEAQVVEIDHDKCRVSLSYKRTKDNPWDDFANKHNIGDKITGTVRNLNEFQVFVSLEEGCEAVIPNEYITWNPRDKFVSPNFTVGDKVTGILKYCDPLREKIQLSIRELTADPLEEFTKNNPTGKVVEGKIVDISNKNLTVELAKDVYGMVKTSEAGIAPTDSLKSLFNVGDEIRAVNQSVTGRYISLSIKDLIK